MGSLAGFIGSLIGALAITFFITRVAIKATGPTRRGAIGAFFIGLAISWLLSITLGAFLYVRGPDWLTLISYTFALLVWLVRDYRNAESQSGCPAESRLTNFEKPARVVEDLSAIPLATQVAVQPTNIVPSKEVIAFRFMLMAWGIGLLILGFACFFYVKAEYESSSVVAMMAMARESIACRKEAFVSIPECNVATDAAYEICEKRARERCNDDSLHTISAQIFADKRLWAERSEDSLYSALVVFLLSSLLFYGIRWAITGRLKPFWLSSR